jgi:hypothetical protein
VLDRRVVAAVREEVPIADPVREPNDVWHIRQFAEAGSRYSSIDSGMREG